MPTARTRRSLRFPIVLALLSVPVHGATGDLSWQERLGAALEMERVLHDHRTWPDANPVTKPAFELAVPAAAVARNVEADLRASAALERWYGIALDDARLDDEIARMHLHTGAPEVLSALEAALGRDPRLLRECLARPLLTERLLTPRYASDARIHGPARRRAEALRARLLAGGEVAGGEKLAYVVQGDWLAAAGPEETLVAVPQERLVALQEEAREEGSVRLVERDDAFVVARTVHLDRWRLEVEAFRIEKLPLRDWLRDDAGATPPVVSALHLPQDVEELYAPQACSEAWLATSTGANVPAARYYHTAVWTGTEMIVWGGVDISSYNTGGRYVPATDSWSATSVGSGVPTARNLHSAVWTGSQMVVWGGFAGGNTNSGGAYSPATNSWSATSTGTNLPAARRSHTAVWTGTAMIVWGGYIGGFPDSLNTGGRYTPASDSWLPTSTGANVPSVRSSHTAIWTGNEMVVWGGGANGSYLNTGGKYAPASDSWTAITTTSAPTGRIDHEAVWNGGFMVVFGGQNNTGFLNTGGRYNVSGNAWAATSTGTNVPAPRAYHTAVWTGGTILVWGGTNFSTWYNSGSRYNPTSDTWALMTTTGAPAGRSDHTAVWSGTDMIVWGGLNSSGFAVNSGGRYTEASSGPGVPTGVSASTSSCTQVAVSWTGGVNATSHNIVRTTGACPSSTSPVTFTGVTSPYADATAAAAQSYCYAVQAVNACGTTSAPGVTGTRLAPPSAPTSISATTNDCTKVTVTWSAGAGATTHDVLRTNGACPSSSGLTTFTNVTSPFGDTSAASGSSYCYVVQAVNACGSTPAAGVTGTRVTGAATAMSVVSLGRSGLDLVLSFAAVPGAQSYNVYRKAAPADPWGTPLASLPGTATSFTDAGEAGTPPSRYYTITNVNGCGIESPK